MIALITLSFLGTSSNTTLNVGMWLGLDAYAGDNISTSILSNTRATSCRNPSWRSGWLDPASEYALLLQRRHVAWLAHSELASASQESFLWRKVHVPQKACWITDTHFVQLRCYLVCKNLHKPIMRHKIFNNNSPYSIHECIPVQDTKIILGWRWWLNVKLWRGPRHNKRKSREWERVPMSLLVYQTMVFVAHLLCRPRG